MFFHVSCLSIIKKHKNLSRFQSMNSVHSSVHGRTSLSSPGSLTIECALVLPVFIMVMAAILSLFSIFDIQLRIQNGMEMAAQKAAAYYYAVEACQKGDSEEKEKVSSIQEFGSELLTGGITAVFLTQQVIESVGAEYINHSRIQGGTLGLSALRSSFPDENQMIDFVLAYRVDIPFVPRSFYSFRFTQRSRRRIWTGTEKKAEVTEEHVYVTENGSVYHKSKECSHIKLNIAQAAYSAIEGLRNQYGSKYYACERCQQALPGSTVYITEKGDCYHSTLTCSGLSRAIREIPISQVGDLKACSRCGK